MILFDPVLRWIQAIPRGESRENPDEGPAAYRNHSHPVNDGSRKSDTVVHGCLPMYFCSPVSLMIKFDTSFSREAVDASRFKSGRAAASTVEDDDVAVGFVEEPEALDSSKASIRSMRDSIE